jgi:UDP-GlcNAc:undecaprenyl-phosphate/decaprenyl-phosphate GlcNAc-1-phosphate transferase
MSNLHLIPLSFLLCAVLVAVFAPLARRAGLVDSPDARKQHAGDVPLVGGLAIYLTLTFTLLLSDLPLNSLRGFFAGSVILVVVGIIDDFHELSATKRLIAQAIAVALMGAWGGVYLADLGHLVSAEEVLALGFLALPFTVFAGVGIINAYNMIDGMDGLCAGMALSCFAAVGVVAWTAADHWTLTVLGLLSAATAGFLLFNVRLKTTRSVRVFLGDAGSTLLGFTVVWVLVRSSQGEQALMSPLTALWFAAIPLLDTVTLMIRRITRGASPFQADQEHLHHLLQRAGFSVNQALAIAIGFSLFAAAVGLLLHFFGVSDWLQALLFAALGVAYFSVSARAWIKLNRLQIA